MKYLTKLDPKKTALIVLNMTHAFIDPKGCFYTPMGDGFAKDLGKFITTIREQGVRIVFTSHSYRADLADANYLVKNNVAQKGEIALLEGTWSTEIDARLGYRKEKDIFIKKHHYSAFFGTELDTLLRFSGIDTVCIVGVNTDCCCLATARDAMCLDYNIAAIAEYNGTSGWGDFGHGVLSDQDQNNIFLTNLANTNCEVLGADQFISLVK